MQSLFIKIYIIEKLVMGINANFVSRVDNVQETVDSLQQEITTTIINECLWGKQGRTESWFTRTRKAFYKANEIKTNDYENFITDWSMNKDWPFMCIDKKEETFNTF